MWIAASRSSSGRRTCRIARWSSGSPKSTRRSQNSITTCSSTNKSGMANDAGHWPRACNGRRRAARLPCCRRDDHSDFAAFEDPAGVLAEVVLDMLHQLRAINYHLGEFVRMSDSIQTQAQSPEEKQRRHATNVRQLQQNMTDQIRDLNAGLETLQNQHPTLAMGGLFNSVHALDSNQRALLDLAKEAAELAAFEIPPAPRLI